MKIKYYRPPCVNHQIKALQTLTHSIIGQSSNNRTFFEQAIVISWCNKVSRTVKLFKNINNLTMDLRKSQSTKKKCTIIPLYIFFLIGQEPGRGQPCRHDVTGSPEHLFYQWKIFYKKINHCLFYFYTRFFIVKECNH